MLAEVGIEFVPSQIRKVRQQQQLVVVVRVWHWDLGRKGQEYPPLCSSFGLRQHYWEWRRYW